MKFIAHYDVSILYKRLWIEAVSWLRRLEEEYEKVCRSSINFSQSAK